MYSSWRPRGRVLHGDDVLVGDLQREGGAGTRSPIASNYGGDNAVAPRTVGALGLTIGGCAGSRRAMTPSSIKIGVRRLNTTSPHTSIARLLRRGNHRSSAPTTKAAAWPRRPRGRPSRRVRWRPPPAARPITARPDRIAGGGRRPRGPTPAMWLAGRRVAATWPIRTA